MLLVLSIQRLMARESDPKPFSILATKQGILLEKELWADL